MNKYTLLILPLISLFYMLNNPSLYSLSLYEMLQVLQRLSQLENHDKALHSSTDHSTPEVSHQGCVERKGQLPQPDGRLLMQLKSLLAFFAQRMHYWLTFSLVSTRTLRSFLIELFPSWMPPR